MTVIQTQNQYVSPTRGSKRARDFSVNTEQPSKKQKISDIACKRIYLEPPFECTRDDALALGLATKQINLLDNLSHVLSQLTGDGDFFQFPENINTERKLPASVRRQIEENENKYSVAVSKLANEIIVLCHRSQIRYREERTFILDYLGTLLENLPVQVESDAENSDSELNAVDLLTFAENPHDPLEEKTIDELGMLLFFVANNLSATSIGLKSTQRPHDLIKTQVQEILTQSKQIVENHASLYQKSNLHDPDEAAFLKLTLEIGKLLILKNGILNHGLIPTLIDTVIPTSLRAKNCTKQLIKRLMEVYKTPLLWDRIEQISPPHSDNLPSSHLIRTFLHLPQDQIINQRDAQIVALSALISHHRQGRAGTCFATAWVIKLVNSHPDLVLEDYESLLQEGVLKRKIYGEDCSLPFQNRVPGEGLSNKFVANLTGKILSIEFPTLTPEEQKSAPTPLSDAYLFEVPGIIAACHSLDIQNVKEVVLSLLVQKKEWSINGFLKALAEHSYNRQESFRYPLRNRVRNTLEEMIHKAQYTYSLEIHHPLQRAFEQASTLLFDCFGSRMLFPQWTYQSLARSIGKVSRNRSVRFQNIHRRLMKELLAPMMARMHYRYNALIEDNITFLEPLQEFPSDHYYGFELYDSGLPKDFEYNTNFYNELKRKSNFWTIFRCQEYTPQYTWKRIDNQIDFQKFLIDVILKTADYLKETHPTYINELKEVKEYLIEKVQSDKFCRLMIENLLGKKSNQRRDLRRNPYTVDSLPWRYFWGGDPESVSNLYFSLKESPAKTLEYSGDAKKILHFHIRYIKKQPDHIKDSWEKKSAETVICSPVHAFLLKPGTPSLKKAWQSDMDPLEYIEKHVENPGLRIASIVATKKIRRALCDYIANNQWVKRDNEKHDFDRLELSNDAKLLFDQKIAQFPRSGISLKEFIDALQKAVIEARAEDPNIGKNYPYWENRWKHAFSNKVKNLLKQHSLEQTIAISLQEKLIEKARNNKDSIALSDDESLAFLEKVKNIPPNLTIQEYRQKVVAIADDIHTQGLGYKDKKWKGNFTPYLDTYLFQLLSPSIKLRWLKSSIVTADTNWKRGIHEIYFAFGVNPGTGKIELCSFYPETNKVQFENQQTWFPTKGRWQFPDNFRRMPEQPIWMPKKFIES